MFQIKDFVSISAGSINHARAVTDKVTDWAPGSVARTLIEAPAVEIEELYLQMFLGLRDAIPVATFKSFGFEKLPAARAQGWVTVSASPAPVQPSVIAVGTTFETADKRVYNSTQAVAWGAGVSSVRVPVLSAVAGIAGNVAAGVIVSSPSFGSGYTISNAAINTGRDVESDAEREARFADFVAALSRGTIDACLYAAKSAAIFDADGNVTEYVTRVGLQENPGIVRIYIYANGGAPSAALVARGQSIIDGSRNDATGIVTPGYRSAGVRVDVLSMAERAVSLSVQVQMLDGYTITPAVTQAMSNQFAEAITAVQPGETLYLGALIETMLEVTGVKAVVPASTANIVCAINEALTPGALTVTAL